MTLCDKVIQRGWMDTPFIYGTLMFRRHRSKQEKKPCGLTEKRVMPVNMGTPQVYNAISGWQKQFSSYNESVITSVPHQDRPQITKYPDHSGLLSTSLTLMVKEEDIMKDLPFFSYSLATWQLTPKDAANTPYLLKYELFGLRNSSVTLKLKYSEVMIPFRHIWKEYRLAFVHGLY